MSSSRRRPGRPAGPGGPGPGRSLRVSGLGWAVLAAAVVLGAGGWWLGWVELTVPAATLVAVLPVAALLTVGRSAYAVELELSEHRVTVGRRAVGRLAVSNASARRLLRSRVELPVGAGAATLDVPSLGPGEVHEELFGVPTSRRAVVPVGPVRSVRGDPLGLLRRTVRWTEPVDLYVHPELVSLAGAAAGVLRDLEGQATRVVSDADLSFHALRDYVPGDDRRHIHWRTTARTGALVVRQFEDTRRTHTAVALSTAETDYADAEEFELAVSVVASIGVQALRDDRGVTVLAAGRALRTDAPGGLLDDTTGLSLSPAGPGSDHLAPWTARQVPGASVAVLVTGSVPTAARLRAGAARLPAGVRTVVLVCASGAPGEVASHGGLSVARVGALADLPRVLRRVVAG